MNSRTSSVLRSVVCKPTFLTTFVVLLALLITTGMSSMAFAASPAARPHPRSPITDRITQHVDDTQLATMSRNTRPEASKLNDRGAVPEGFQLDHILLQLQRSAEKEKEVETFIESLNTPGSPNYHQWLTADQFGAQFGVAQEDIDAVTGWLESHGFIINKVYANHMLIDFSGNAGQIKTAFHTEMHNLEVNGETHLSNMSDPMIPLALAPVVKGIASLNDFKPHPMYKVKTPDYTFAGCASATSLPTEPGTCYAVTAQDTWAIYGLNPLLSAGITGAGQTIAVIEDTDTYGGPADMNSYKTAFGLTSYGGTYTQIHPGVHRSRHQRR